MALFGGERDVSLFRHLNKELINKFIDTEILLYKLNLSHTRVNIYEEATTKNYQQPVLIHCLIAVEDPAWNNEDYSSDVTQSTTFSFLRDTLVELDCAVQIGDIVEYQSRFYELDDEIENQHFVGKNPDNWMGGTSHGYSVSVIFRGHQTRQSNLNIVETRFGTNTEDDNYTLPENI